MKSRLLAALCVAALPVLVNAKPVDLGRETRSTPYEAYMGPVKKVLNQVDGRENDFDRVRELLRIGRSFRYSFTEPYVAATPQKTAASRRGDCKAKSLWLIDALNDTSARYVIGKTWRNSPINHAWVIWNDGQRWWILDPTNKSRPIPADRVSPREYIPLYSYSTAGAHRHMDTLVHRADNREAVAAKQKNKSRWGNLFQH